MVDSTFGALAVLLLAAVALFFVNPVIALLPLLLLVAFLGLKAGAALFKNAAPPVDTTGGGVGAAPSVPSSGEASYDAVTNPSDRGV